MDPEGQVSLRGGQLRRVTSIYSIPDNAVILGNQKVLTLQWKMISEWKPRMEMWPFIHGPGLLGGMGAIGGILCNNHFRTKFDVRHFGRTPSYLALAVVPAAMAMVTHNLWITNSLLLGRFDCLLCAQVRSGSIQAVLGTLYPLIMAPPIAIVIARKYWTYPVPKISQSKEVFNMLWMTTYPFKYKFIGLLLCQFLMGSGVAKQEYKVFNRKLSAGMLPPTEEMSAGMLPPTEEIDVS